MTTTAAAPTTSPTGAEDRLSGRGSSALLVWLALGTVYVVWGSTYLSIRIMVRDMPPLLAAGGRYLAAGLLLGVGLGLTKGWSVLRVRPRQLAGAALLGLLLPAGGNGLVTVGEQSVASGIAALLVAAVPLWVILLRTASGDRPRVLTWLGVLVGFGGLVVLVARSGSQGATHLAGVLIIVVATLCWSLGSWSQPRLTLPANPFVTTVYEMLAGGVVLLVGAAASGERVHLTSYAASSWLAWAYLVTFGSIVAFSAYVWVLGQAPLSLVATYAYVNPVVAVALGALVLSEPVTGGVLLGGLVVVAGVAIVVSGERRPRAARRLPAPRGAQAPQQRQRA